MKKRQFILCAVFCATCAAAADSQKSAEQPVDLGKLFMAFGKLSLSSVKKGFEYGYSKLKPTNFTDGLVKALVLNNIAWTGKSIAGSIKSAPGLNLLSTTVSAPTTYIAAKLLTAGLVQEGMSKNNQHSLYIQSFMGLLPYVHLGTVSLFSQLTGNSAPRQLSENEQKEEALKELRKATKIKGPAKKDQKDAIKKDIEDGCTSGEKGIKTFTQKLVEFDPDKDTRTPTLFMYGHTSSGKTAKIKKIAKLARTLGYTTHIIYQSSMIQKQTYVGVASKVLNTYGDELVEMSKKGEKVMVFLDEAFSAANETASREGKTGNNNDDFTTFLDKLVKNKIPCVFGSNTFLDELQEQVRSRVDGSKTENEGISVLTGYPNADGIANAFKNMITHAKKPIPCLNIMQTSKLIGHALNDCNLGIVYNTFRNIIDKHTKKRLIIDIASPESLDIIIPELATQLNKAIEGTKSSLLEVTENTSVVKAKRKRRAKDFQKNLSRYQQQYSFLLNHTITITTEEEKEKKEKKEKVEKKISCIDLLIKDAFLNSERLYNSSNPNQQDGTVFDKIKHLKHTIKREKKKEKEDKNEKKIEEKIEKIEEKKPEEKKINEKVEEKLNKEEENSASKKLTKLLKKIKKVAEKNTPSAVIKLFNDNTTSVKNACTKYDPSLVEKADDLVRFHNEYDADGESHINIDEELNETIVKYAQLKHGYLATDKDFMEKLQKYQSENPEYIQHMLFREGKKLSKKIAQKGAKIGYNLSYYTALVNLPAILSGGLKTLSSYLPKSEIKKSTSDLCAPIGPIAKFYQVQHKKALTAMLGNMIRNTENPYEQLAKTMQALVSDENEKKYKLAQGPTRIYMPENNFKEHPNKSVTVKNTFTGCVKEKQVNMHQWAEKLISGGYISKKGDNKN